MAVHTLKQPPKCTLLFTVLMFFLFISFFFSFVFFSIPIFLLVCLLAYFFRVAFISLFYCFGLMRNISSMRFVTGYSHPQAHTKQFSIGFRSNICHIADYVLLNARVPLCVDWASYEWMWSCVCVCVLRFSTVSKCRPMYAVVCVPSLCHYDSDDVDDDDADGLSFYTIFFKTCFACSQPSIIRLNQFWFYSANKPDYGRHSVGVDDIVSNMLLLLSRLKRPRWSVFSLLYFTFSPCCKFDIHL